MREIITQLICFSYAIFLVSCTDNSKTINEYNTSELYFNNALKLEGEPLKTQYVAENQFICYYTDYGFIGNMSLSNNKQIHWADFSTGEIKASACTYGRGPGEILTKSPDMSIYKNSLYVLDQRTGRVKAVEVVEDSLKVGELFKLELESPGLFLELETLSDSLFAVLFQSYDNMKCLLLVDNKNTILDSVDYYLLNDSRIDYSRFRYNIDMKISPCKNYLFVRGDYNSVSKYKIADNKITFQKQMFLVEPLYEIKESLPIKKGSHMELNPNIFIGDKYVYIVANPELQHDKNSRFKKSVSEGIMPESVLDDNSHILVFDYDFNFIKSYLCDCNARFLALPPDPSVVYATDMTNNRLVKYILSGLD